MFIVEKYVKNKKNPISEIFSMEFNVSNTTCFKQYNIFTKLPFSYFLKIDKFYDKTENK